MLHLRQEEIRQHPAHNGGAAPNIPTLASQIPARGIQNLRRQKDHRDLRNVVPGAADAGAQRAQAHRRRLADDRVRDGAERAGEDERDDDAEDRLRVVGGGGLRDRRAHAEEHQEHDVGRRAPEVDSAAAEPACDEPGADVGYQAEAGVDQAELEGEVGRHAGLWEWDVSLVQVHITTLKHPVTEEEELGHTHAQRKMSLGWQSGYQQSSARRRSST